MSVDLMFASKRDLLSGGTIYVQEQDKRFTAFEMT